MYHLAVAVGDGVNQDLDLVLLEDDLSAPAAGEYHLRLSHLAPFAPGAAAADVRLQDGSPTIYCRGIMCLRPRRKSAF